MSDIEKLENLLNSHKEILKDYEKKEITGVDASTQDLIEKTIFTLKSEIELIREKILEVKDNEIYNFDFEEFLNSLDLNSEELIFVSKDKAHLDEMSWKDSVSSFTKRLFSSSKENKEDDTLLFDEEKKGVKLKDGILYADSHLDLIGYKLEEDNILILTNDSDFGRLLRFSRDGWFQALPKTYDLKNVHIKKVKSLNH